LSYSKSINSKYSENNSSSDANFVVLKIRGFVRTANIISCELNAEVTEMDFETLNFI